MADRSTCDHPALRVTWESEADASATGARYLSLDIRCRACGVEFELPRDDGGTSEPAFIVVPVLTVCLCGGTNGYHDAKWHEKHGGSVSP